MAKRAILAMAIAAFAIILAMYVSASASVNINLEYSRYNVSNYPYSTVSGYGSYYPGYYPTVYSSTTPYYYGSTYRRTQVIYIPEDYYSYNYWRYYLFPNMTYGNVARVIYDPTYPSATSSFTGYSSSYASPAPAARYPASATYSGSVCRYTTGC